MPPKFRQLSSSDQFRVCRLLTRGAAPEDPELAAITLEAAEYYQTRDRVVAEVFRWCPFVVALSVIGSTLLGARDGQVEMVSFFLLGVLGVIGNLMLNPWTRPKNVTRSAEASKRVLASRGAET